MKFTTDTTSFPSSKEFDACANETCCNHGTCVDGYCECDEGWMGARCCEQNCSGAINKPYCTTKEDEYDENGCKTIHYYPAPCGTDEYCDGGTGCKIDGSKCTAPQTYVSEETEE